MNILQTASGDLWTHMTYILSFLGGVSTWVAKGAFGYYRDRNQFKLLCAVFPIREVKWWDHLFEYARGRPRARLQVRTSLVKAVGGTNPATYRAYVHVAEVDELVKMVKQLAAMGVEVDYQPDCSIDTGVGAVLIGSDANLHMSGSILKNLGPNIDWKQEIGAHAVITWKRGNEEPLKCDHAPYVYIDETNQTPVTTKRVSEDYGIVVRKEMDDGVDVLLCAGMHMHGTAAALRTALQKGFQQEVKRTGCGHFAKVLKAHVDENGLSLAVDPVERTKFPLQKLSREDSRADN
jgi:hypothetical protein